MQRSKESEGQLIEGQLIEGSPENEGQGQG